jgi:hypothetical protein
MKLPRSCYELCGYWDSNSLWKLLGSHWELLGPMEAPVEAPVETSGSLWKLLWKHLWKLLGAYRSL